MSYPGPPQKTATQQTWEWLREVMLSLIYPRVCRVCQVVLDEAAPLAGLENSMCKTCLNDLVRIDAPYCSVCGEPFAGAMDRAFKCSNCEGRRLAFEFAISGFKATGAMRELLHQFKYSGDLTLRSVLADALIHTLDEPRLAAEDLSTWVLVPVPLHWLREMRREFNQSWELCLQLSARTGIPAARVLRRNRMTLTQAKLSRTARLQNLRGVFSVGGLWPPRCWKKPQMQGKKVLLVDDVLTTGTTAHECAKILKRDAGAEKVVVITVARG